MSKKNEHFDLWKPKEVNIKESYFATDFTVAIPTINIFLHLKRDYLVYETWFTRKIIFFKVINCTFRVCKAKNLLQKEKMTFDNY